MFERAGGMMSQDEGTKQEKINRWLDNFFWKTICCRVDKQPVWLWGRYYRITGRIAGYFHRRHCERCMVRNGN